MDINKIIIQIASKNNTTPFVVKREIKKAIDAAFEHPNSTALSIPRKGKKPTIEEFLVYAYAEATKRRTL